jgi:uncharacterized membrane protein YkoI
MKHLRLAVLAFLAAFAVATSAAFAYTGQEYAKQAKVSIAQARAIALRQVPAGKITDEELEPEAGGSGLRYSFDVTAGGKVYEIGVDAKTGALLERSVDGGND